MGARDGCRRGVRRARARDTPSDAPDLPGAQAEADHLAALLAGATVLVGADATRDAVLDALPASGWAHFACHGYSDPDNPSDSHLALHDHDRAPVRRGDPPAGGLSDGRFLAGRRHALARRRRRGTSLQLAVPRRVDR
ncbi:CHAT domain-containing protein [Streptomyces sp. Ru62]|uniref:CHAT domain-containing protein n=1 Tax=Streptomyces sp. Ru62 TaxID=2080745 RepID=UPI0035BC0F92